MGPAIKKPINKNAIRGEVKEMLILVKLKTKHLIFLLIVSGTELMNEALSIWVD